MLLKPMVPLSPKTVMDTTVELADWFMVMLDIWALVTFPLTPRLTVAPLSVLALIIVSAGVGEGVGFVVGVGLLIGVFVGVVV